MLKPERPMAESTGSSDLLKQMAELRRRRTDAHEAGIPALRRLFQVAKRDTGQSRRIAKFLLGLYNGTRFPFDLTDFRGLDAELFDDCLTVLKMDFQPMQEVHCYFERGGELFEKLREAHAVEDIWKMRLQLESLKSGHSDQNES